MSQLDAVRAAGTAEKVWEQEIVPALEHYIRIPNRSQAYDPQWRAAGHMHRAVELVAAWCRKQAEHIPGLTVEVKELPGKAPVILMEAPGEGTDTVLLYGHLDKQPEMEGWSETTQGARSWRDLPANAIKYVRRIEELIGAPVALLGTSPQREDMILVRDPFQD